jgi:hypothetical protein
MHEALLLSVALLGMPQGLTQKSGADDEVQLPAPAARQVKFHEEILPILSRRCAECHVGANPKGKLGIESRESLLRGGASGPAVIVGNSAESLLIELVAGMDPVRVMPASDRPRLNAEEIGLLRAWIDKGLEWEEGLTITRPVKTARLEPRRPDLPPAEPGSGLTNPIDRLLQPYFRERGITPGEVVPDRQFARRAFLDIVGLLPSPDEIAALENDTRPDKRERLVRSLLEDRKAYADHWLTFWNDALRNAYRGTGFIDDGRRQITGWLYRALYDNMPYDAFVRQLIRPVPGSEGFTRGIIWRGVVNASQRPEMQAAQTISQVFMGTNIKCASCHDSFINQWKLTEAYGLANVFADEPLEIHRCDKPTGQLATTAFLYPQLGSVDAKAPKTERLGQLAKLVTSSENGRLARTIVNRLWTSFFGRGLVEAVDDMDQDPWNADLLDWLAADLQEHGYDLKHTMALIATSRAYQYASVGAPGPEEKSFVFRGPLVRRMSAEQFVDAVAQLTDAWQRATPEMLKLDDRRQGGQLAAVLGAISEDEPGGEVTWIWSHADASRSDPGGRVFLRKVVDLSGKPARATAAVTCDNEFVLYVNGQKAASGDDWQTPVQVDLAPWLVQGQNLIAVEAINWPDPATGKGLQFPAGNPAGFAFLGVAWKGDEEIWTASSDATWRWTDQPLDGWEKPGLDDSGWEPAVVLAEADRALWRRGDRMHALLRPAAPSRVRVRAVLADADSLTRTLGRPDREQVVTRRDSIATTLQALELTNGSRLAEMLKVGAAYWLGRPEAAAPDRLIDAIYRTGIGRPPTDEELAVGRELAGSPVAASGLEDLLWVVVMLPDFQLID